VSDEPKPLRPRPALATDLVEYFVVVLPERAALRGIEPALADMVRSERIRVLDLVVVERAPDGSVEVVEVGDVDDLASLRDMDGQVGLLSENDLRLASGAVRAGEVGLVLVAEDRWAEQLSAAARRVGGEIVAGERIPARRVEATAGELADDETGG
jgi:Family of unknown function (DUF6325)